MVGGASALAACGSSASGCSKVDLTTEYRFNFDDTLATIRNSSNDPKIVTLSVIDDKGEERWTVDVNVAAKGFESEEVDQPRDQEKYKVQLKSCK